MTPVVDQSAASRRDAAVALVVRGRGEDARLLFVRRATYAGDPWSGHIALPGGRAEPGDPSLDATARRETWEETGVQLDEASCVATLATITPRHVHLPALTIHPFVFTYLGAPDVAVSPEIAEAWWHPIAALRAPGAWTTVEVRAGDAMRAVRGYRWGDHVVWGITERILADFLARIDAGAMPELFAP